MTYYVLLGLALLIAALGFVVRRRSDATGQGMVLLGCIGCVACIGWQVRQTLFTPTPKGPDRGQAVVSYILANKVLSEVGDQQGTILLLFPPESVMDEETLGTYSGTFSRVLRGLPGLKVESLTLPIPAKATKAGQVTLAAFMQACTNTPALAYVSFTGVPADVGNLLSAKPKPAPGFFVFDPWGTTNWLSGLKQGCVRVAIVPRPGLRSAGDPVAGEPNEVFNALYLMATPSTADQIALELKAR